MAIDALGPPEPIRRVARVVIIVVAILSIIGWLRRCSASIPVCRGSGTVITYGEVKQSPSGWEDIKMSFQSDLTDLIDGYRNVINKHEVSRILTGAADIVEKDEGWIYDEANLEPEGPESRRPWIRSSPDTVAVGNAALLIIIATGTGFVDGYAIVFDGVDRSHHLRLRHRAHHQSNRRCRRSATCRCWSGRLTEKRIRSTSPSPNPYRRH